MNTTNDDESGNFFDIWQFGTYHHPQNLPSRSLTLPMKKLLGPNRKGSSSNHHFSGINSLLNFGGVFVSSKNDDADLKFVHIDLEND